MHELYRETWIPQPLQTVFPFFAKAENLEAITPPWLCFKVITPRPIQMSSGTKIAYRLRVRGFPISWLTEIEMWKPPFSFVDSQLRGPYRLWRHTHTFAERQGGTFMTDRVEYTLPLGPLGRLVHTIQVRRDVEAIFDYRAARIGEIFT
jgi:ligand-binding SRPBCC domain-containing protein